MDYFLYVNDMFARQGCFFEFWIDFMKQTKSVIPDVSAYLQFRIFDAEILYSTSMAQDEQSRETKKKVSTKEKDRTKSKEKPPSKVLQHFFY